ncbi:aminomethyl-transferring glycine dehydrogenase [Candidatus Neomarinimicrobiota bacterium]
MKSPMEKNNLIYDNFVDRHIGPNSDEISAMLEAIGTPDIEKLIEETIPESIRSLKTLKIRKKVGENDLLDEARSIFRQNELYRSFIGLGYHNTITPSVILRNILENPGWYTQYTPYQAEISQGRLEALLNFQTMIADLTGLEIANASLLDEATAAAEAMAMFYRETHDAEKNVFLVSQDCHPQTIEVIKTRAYPLGIKLVIDDHKNFTCNDSTFGLLLQYPTSAGEIIDYGTLCETAHRNDTFVVVATDIMSLVVLQPPGEFGADAAVGSSQRFGVPLGYGGPHAAFFATTQSFKRKIPGRIIGVSVDRLGDRALRMALQTREQHIRREKATSNICTAQVLLAIMAAMYAVYHGPRHLKRIANGIHRYAKILAAKLKQQGHEILYNQFFDTIKINPQNLSIDTIKERAKDRKINLRHFKEGAVGISLDETTNINDINDLLSIFLSGKSLQLIDQGDFKDLPEKYGGVLKRSSPILTHPVFHSYHSETEMMRYIHRLESKDLSLNISMISLGSCTMKLNGVTEMIPLTWPELANIHPYVPIEQAQGYQTIIVQLGKWLTEITGFTAVSMQPNSGAQGEFTGLMVIRNYHIANNDDQRNVCLIPASAHGTNPASATMAGMKVLVVSCDENGNIDIEDLKTKAEANRDKLAALMVTYPSTHGVFEEQICDICDIIHANGGQVYLDGANLNAMVGLCRPADFGADVIHINLHKTFAIPHGGGGPGMGPICTAEHLANYLPNHPFAIVGGNAGTTPVASAAWGSASILTISWAYIALMSGDGLTLASKIAILNANYMAAQLQEHFPILYKGRQGRVAHEFILDLRPFKASSGITDEDVAKRLIDYGFHAPTMSFPVPGTLMIEPTESESKKELDRLCEALIRIKLEILDVEEGRSDRENNVLKNAPHTAFEIASDEWPHPYQRIEAAYPVEWTREHKFWPSVSRVDNAYGDRNLFCTCPPVSDYQK